MITGPSVARKGKAGKTRGDMEVNQTIPLYADGGTLMVWGEKQDVCMYQDVTFAPERQLGKIEMIHIG